MRNPLRYIVNRDKFCNFKSIKTWFKPTHVRNFFHPTNSMMFSVHENQNYSFKSDSGQYENSSGMSMVRSVNDNKCELGGSVCVPHTQCCMQWALARCMHCVVYTGNPHVCVSISRGSPAVQGVSDGCNKI